MDEERSIKNKASTIVTVQFTNERVRFIFFVVYIHLLYIVLYVAFNTAEDVRYRTICTDCLFFPAEKVA